MEGHAAGKLPSWDLHRGGLTFPHSGRHVNGRENYRPVEEKAERLIRRERAHAAASVKGPGEVGEERALPFSH